MASIADNAKNYINHVALVIDESSSMSDYTAKVVEVFDEVVKSLAEESKRFDQETRVTLYTFSSTTGWATNNAVKCVVYDKDVLRLPSLRGQYRPNGMTALMDATALAVADLKLTATKYGEHAFAVYAITDGHENASSITKERLRAILSALDDNWTMVAVVPGERGAAKAIDMGFPGGNVTTWDATSAAGVASMGETIRASTVTLMDNRTRGIRGTKTLFKVDSAAITTDTVKAANLTPLDPSSYLLVPVGPEDLKIKEFVERGTSQYQVGRTYYLLNSGRKPKGRSGVIVQGNKDIIVVEKSTRKAFGGPEARRLVGLSDATVTVDPTDTSGEFYIFVQSTSLNRLMFKGTDALIRLGK